MRLFVTAINYNWVNRFINCSDQATSAIGRNYLQSVEIHFFRSAMKKKHQRVGSARTKTNALVAREEKTHPKKTNAYIC